MPRTCKRLTALDVAKGKSVPYVCYCPCDGQGLETVCMHSFDSLREPKLKPPSLAKLNVSVTVSWMPNWSGYMQTLCHGDHPAGYN